MQSHYKIGMNRRDEEYYEQEDYDDYEDDGEGSEEEEEVEKEEPLNSKEQQEFLSLREQLKENIRQKLKKQGASAFGSQPQINKKKVTNDKFGSFFGPSQPVIASRVLDERRSIQETNHILSHIRSSTSGNTKDPASTTSEKKSHVHVKVINEVKKKAQTLKGMRDYSFLLSDDADFPVSDKEQQRQPEVRKPAPNSDVRSTQASLKVKPPMGQPMPARTVSARPVLNVHESKTSVAKNLQPKTRVYPLKGAVMSRPRPVSSEHRKVVGGNGSSGPIGHKSIPSKVSVTATGANRSGASRPTAKVMNEPTLKKKMKPSQKIRVRDGSEDRSKKKPMKRRFDEEDKDPIQLIRNMFKYDPRKFAGIDDDDDIAEEANFHQILKEERISSKEGKREDDIELLKIEEEERKERTRKKQKLRQRERNR